MVHNMVIHRRGAMSESTRRATLNQELIRRMVNTLEIVDNTKTVEESGHGKSKSVRVVSDFLKGAILLFW